MKWILCLFLIKTKPKTSVLNYSSKMYEEVSKPKIHSTSYLTWFTTNGLNT